MNIRKLLYDNHWTIGFVQNGIDSILRGDKLIINWVDNHYKDRWFADPFILDVDSEKITLLVEEFYDPINRGRISKVVVDKKTNCINEVKTVLELPSHLSFPAILRKDGRIYIYPENSNAGELNLYEYDPLNDNCIKIQTLSKEPLTDAVLTDLLGENMIFSTHIPNQNGNVLSCYSLQNNEFVFVKEYTFDSNIARNAGDWFEFNGKIYRSAQDCNTRYGGAMFIQEVHRSDNELISFTNVRRIEEYNGKYTLGCHTFNHYNGVTVIDVNGYRRPFLAKLGLLLVSLKHKLK